MRRIVTVSYTPLDAPGGVPRWNRDFHSAFPDRETRHFSWWDAAPSYGLDPNDQGLPEWRKAELLNHFLLQKKLVTGDDVIVADSFWARGLEDMPFAVSIQHGNWSHTTKDDVDRGVPPEFPEHAREQLNFRRRWVEKGKRAVAVSKFISDQCRLQWGFEFPYINNGIDTEKFKPNTYRTQRSKPLLVHFVTNQNKGYNHIELVRQKLDVDMCLLDEAAANQELVKKFQLRFTNLTDLKYHALAQADLAIVPSAHEGNSYAVLETLACGVPLVTYNVGLMWELWERRAGVFGVILDRRQRSPELTLEMTGHLLRPGIDLAFMGELARNQAMEFSIEKFRRQWREYVDGLG